MTGLILAAGKANETICQLFGDIPGTLVPVNGLPVISHIMENFIQQNIKLIYIAVGYKKGLVKNSILRRNLDGIIVRFIEVDFNKKPGNTLIASLEKINDGKLVINLGDTIIKPTPHFDDYNNIIFTSLDYSRSTNWCTVDTDLIGRITKFSDKVEYKEGSEAVTGLYILDHRKKYLREFNLKNKNDNIEISEYLDYLSKKICLKTENSRDWLDFGHLDLYQQSKKKMLKSRFFNSLDFDDLLGTVTKKSENGEKFSKEIKWMLNVPKKIKIFFPRVVDFSLDTPQFMTMEYYSYTNLSEIWLFSSFSDLIFETIIKRVMRVLEKFHEERRVVELKFYKSVYIDKTEKRIKQLLTSKGYFNDVFGWETITINNQHYQNWFSIKDQIYELCLLLYNKDHNCLIHGDFCFSNILYDMGSGIIRLIDPRGSWDKEGNGDIKYDIAKLSHSINGNYDFIVNDLFEVEMSKEKIVYRIFLENRHIQASKYFSILIKEQYDIYQIRLIEGLLFLSMLPLHSDYPNRQLVMYCKAIEILNDVLKHYEK